MIFNCTTGWGVHVHVATMIKHHDTGCCNSRPVSCLARVVVIAPLSSATKKKKKKERQKRFLFQVPSHGLTDGEHLGVSVLELPLNVASLSVFLVDIALSQIFPDVHQQERKL